MNRKAVDILFPIPNELPNEDTWLEIALGHTNLIKIVHSDVLCCFWRMHEGNSVSMKTPYKDFKKAVAIKNNKLSIVPIDELTTRRDIIFYK